MANNPVVVFLYTELAGYIKNCMDLLASVGVDVHVFAYPINPEAPFQFDLEASSCTFYPRFDLDYGQLRNKIDQIDPAMIVCSGWIDKDYVELCRYFKADVKTVLALDNKPSGDFQSRASLLRAKWRYKSAYSHAWVPGQPQEKYARKMGFAPSEIQQGFYTADLDKFQKMDWLDRLNVFPKRFVFLGRYLEFKGVRELWTAFQELGNSGWTLECAGEGELFEQRTAANGIVHKGFVQGDEMDKFVAAGGVFVMPSHREPWGVVLQEFVAAGYPVICSTEVGAASEFLRADQNGYLVKPGNAKLLEETMRKLISLPDQKLFEMGRKSRQLARTMSPEHWVQTATDLIEQK